jgi:hypothetical protein
MLRILFGMLTYTQCDEVKPRCSNCKRRQVRCDFDLEEPIPRLADGGTTKKSGDLQLSQIELTYHWSTTTSQSLSAWWSGATVWQNLLGGIALDHPHVLHFMFALTALQLARCRVDRQEEYIMTADHHYELALTSVTNALADINADNREAILLSVQLVCFVTWARGPQPGEYLAFSKHGKSDWLVMFRGVRTALESSGEHSFSKRQGATVQIKNRPLPPTNEPRDYIFQLSELREHVSAISLPSESEENVLSVDVLQQCYSNRYGGVDSEYHVAFGWLYRMSDDFIDRLQRRDSLPLVIYAHFVVLLHDMERFWYMEGWTHHVMKGIYEALGSGDNPWIRWPMAKVGWIAP